MKGKSSLVSKTEVTSPRQKHKVMSMINARSPFKMNEYIMVLGTVYPASLTSSAADGPLSVWQLPPDLRLYLHICTAQSKPSVPARGVDKPTNTAVPILFQPPKLVNSVNTAFALLRGAKIHNGVMITIRPKT